MQSDDPREALASTTLSRGARVFISYRSEPPDIDLAREFFKALATAGHHPFMAGESIRLGEKWPQRISDELEGCDYLLLLLSARAATSEMVIEEIRMARDLRNRRGGEKPQILTIRVDLPFEASLNYDLAGYLSSIQQRQWKSGSDPEPLIGEILSLLAGSATGAKECTALAPSPPIPPDSTGPPLPVASPELPEGQVDLASAFYIERPPIESSCKQMVERPGALIRIKAPRQMGKTSLLARVLAHAAASGQRTVVLSFQLADGAILCDLDDLLRWFCGAITWALGVPDRYDTFSQLTGSKTRAFAYFERYLLEQVGTVLTLGLDELDLVFQHPEVAADFFGMLRAWHEAGKSLTIWKNLRLVLVHSTEVYIPLRINQSPFNVGLPVELPDFTTDQVQDLALRHGLRWGTSEVATLTSIVGGHPFLVRLAQYYIVRGEITLDQLLATASTEAGLYGDHLRRHLWNLEQHPELEAAMRQVVMGQQPVRLDSDIAFKLESMGLVNLRANEVSPRCELYRTYFRERLKPRS